MGVPELEQQISAQGLKVRSSRPIKRPDTVKAEVAVLLKQSRRSRPSTPITL